MLLLAPKNVQNAAHNDLSNQRLTMKSVLSFFQCVAAFYLLVAIAQAGDTYRFYHENVLGTSLELNLNADSFESADQTEQAVLVEIERLRKVLSVYDATSELSQWNTSRSGTLNVSNDLYAVFKRSDQLSDQTAGAFDPNVHVATELWKRCESEQRLPGESELKEAISTIASRWWQLTKTENQILKRSLDSVCFDAIAKGYIIDRAGELAMARSGITGGFINIGGDLRCFGDAKVPVSIPNPFQNEDNANPIASVELYDRAIATSGNYHRGFYIAGQRYSHIIDPRSAKPTNTVVSSSVIAKDAVTADALATAFSVLDIKESLQVCIDSQEVDCLLVLADGSVVQSDGWPSPVYKSPIYVAVNSPIAKSGEIWKDSSKLVVELEINNASQGGRYRRPYIAVWIEDENDFPVRTLALWLQTSEPGPRWHRDLRVWFKNDSMRKLVDGKNLIGTVSSATKAPGKYKVAWNGEDDHGQPVKKGKYTLLVEAAREHGTYQIIKKPIELSDSGFKEVLEGNVEIKQVAIEYQLTDK